MVTTTTKKKPSDWNKWGPKAADRICSLHFIDGAPSLAHPNPPFLHLGNKQTRVSRHRLPSKKRQALTCRVPPIEITKHDSDNDPHAMDASEHIVESFTEDVIPSSTYSHSDHTYCHICLCSADRTCEGCVNELTHKLNKTAVERSRH